MPEQRSGTQRPPVASEILLGTVQQLLRYVPQNREPNNPDEQMYAMDSDKDVERGPMRIPGDGNALTEQFRSRHRLHPEKRNSEQYRCQQPVAIRRDKCAPH